MPQRALTHFRRSGDSAPPAARRRNEAAVQTAASDKRPADGAGAGRRQRSRERARGRPGPAPAPAPPALPGDLQGLGGGRGPGGSGAMFVQEEKIFAGKVLRLHVCASDGAEWLEEATEDTSVEQLKERCLKHVRPAAAPGLRASLPPRGLGQRFPPRPPSTFQTFLPDPGTGLSAVYPTFSFNLYNPGGRGRSGNRLAEAKSPRGAESPGFPASLLLGWGS